MELRLWQVVCGWRCDTMVLRRVTLGRLEGKDTSALAGEAVAGYCLRPGDVGQGQAVMCR